MIRYLSWTFVFGAVATLLYTSFKPFWNELLSGEFPPDQIQGAMIESRETPPEAEASGNEADAALCGENHAADERCVAQNP